jgi:murein L,D-transpeptidase YcbB/YkuD
MLADAVKRFQVRHGLAATGTVTPRTLAALNVSVQKRIKQLEASLERLGQMNFPFGQRYVVVNIPATFAEAIEDDKVVRRYRVIVGKTEKPSPTLTADITSVNLNPTWTVPSSIAKSETISAVTRPRSALTAGPITSGCRMLNLISSAPPAANAVRNCGRSFRRPAWGLAN